VFDGVDDRLAHRDAHPVERIVVEPDQPSDVIADGLHEVHHLERAAEVEADAVAAVGHQACRRDPLRRLTLGVWQATLARAGSAKPAPRRFRILVL
jgi:hypothetical protein